MNNETYIIKKFIYKYKYIILALLVILSLIYFFTPVVEGMTSIGEYDYLEPVPKDNSWTDTTWKAFIDKMNSVICPTGTGTNCIPNPPSDEFKKDVSEYATEAEAQYYIENGKWPYNQYVIKKAATDPEASSKLLDFQKNISNRGFYDAFFQYEESLQNPLPLSYQIFTGKTKAP